MESTTLLLVDDEQDFVEALEKRLRRRAFEVFTAPSGEAALEVLAREDTIEVVVLDMKMVGMSGHETLQEIRERHPEVEVVMLTGHGTVQGAIDAVQAGARDYLMKPCDFERLLEIVAKVKARKRRRTGQHPAQS